MKGFKRPLINFFQNFLVRRSLTTHSCLSVKLGLSHGYVVHHYNIKVSNMPIDKCGGRDKKGSEEFKMTHSVTTRSRTAEWRLRVPTSLSTISSLWFTTIRLDLQNVVKLATGKILPFLYQSYLIYFISIWLASCPCCSPCPRS